MSNLGLIHLNHVAHILLLVGLSCRDIILYLISCLLIRSYKVGRLTPNASAVLEMLLS